MQCIVAAAYDISAGNLYWLPIGFQVEPKELVSPSFKMAFSKWTPSQIVLNRIEAISYPYQKWTLPPTVPNWSEAKLEVERSSRKQVLAIFDTGSLWLQSQ